MSKHPHKFSLCLIFNAILTILYETNVHVDRLIPTTHTFSFHQPKTFLINSAFLPARFATSLTALPLFQRSQSFFRTKAHHWGLCNQQCNVRAVLFWYHMWKTARSTLEVSQPQCSLFKTSAGKLKCKINAQYNLGRKFATMPVIYYQWTFDNLVINQLLAILNCFCYFLYANTKWCCKIYW